MFKLTVNHKVYEFSDIEHLELALAIHPSMIHSRMYQVAHTVYCKETRCFLKNRDIGHVRLNELLELTR